MNRSRILFVFEEMMFLISGMWMIFNTGESLNSVVRTLGSALAGYWYLRIMEYLIEDEENKVPFRFAMASILTATYLFIAIVPHFFEDLLPIAAGITAGILGIQDIDRALVMKEESADISWFLLTLSSYKLVFAIVITMNPFSAVEALVTTLGIFLILTGILDILAVIDRNALESYLNQ